MKNGKTIFAKQTENIIKSFDLLSVARKSNIYIERILTYIVSLHQEKLQCQQVDGIIIKLTPQELHEFKSIKHTLDLTQFGDEMHNNRYLQALSELQQMSLRHTFIDENGKEYLWTGHLIGEVFFQKSKGIVDFTMGENSYHFFYNFMRGFRKYTPVMAFKFSSAYTERFYELVSYQSSKKTITMTVKKLKKWLALEDKYQDIDNFL